jgi:uncharacterized OB-fold protein
MPLIYCNSCGRKHRMSLQLCPECGVYEIMMPSSEKVMDSCHGIYRCDGCEAYREHMS